MVLMVSSLHLLMLLIAIELASLPSYAIVAFRKRSRLGAEASVKYVIFGSVSAAIMLYGASLLYGYYGTFDLQRSFVLVDAVPVEDANFYDRAEIAGGAAHQTPEGVLGGCPPGMAAVPMEVGRVDDGLSHEESITL